jgi:hypothetical protein
VDGGPLEGQRPVETGRIGRDHGYGLDLGPRRKLRERRAGGVDGPRALDHEDAATDLAHMGRRVRQQELDRPACRDETRRLSPRSVDDEVGREEDLHVPFGGQRVQAVAKPALRGLRPTRRGQQGEPDRARE